MGRWIRHGYGISFLTFRFLFFLELGKSIEDPWNQKCAHGAWSLRVHIYLNFIIIV
jgi:hypothetical protein